METIDPKVLAGMAAVTVAVIGALKKAFPKHVKGKEDFIAFVIPILFVIAMKLSGQFAGTEWVDALIWAAATGPVAGLLHDKVVNPVLKSAGASAPGKPPAKPSGGA